MARTSPEFLWKYHSILVICAAAAILPGAAKAQPAGTATRIQTVPSGLSFQVDGQTYVGPMTAMWPAGSKHTLYATPNQSQNNGTYGLVDWEFPGGKLLSNPVTITADPSITEFTAVFLGGYELSIQFNSCQSASPCGGPGVITVNNVPITSDQNQWFAAGSVVILQAFPNPGYVFEGWTPGLGQLIQGLQDTVTMNSALTVRPVFQGARPVNFATSPPGLQVLADRTPVTTPAMFEWGYGSLHSVGGISPQQDSARKWWAFSSWSDGGALNHAYTVANAGGADTLTATYVPAEHVAFVTSPLNLNLTIDGRSNSTPYVFMWGVGETHQIDASAQQTDSQGRIWAFANWSVGGPAVQNFVVPVTADSNMEITATFGPLAHVTVGSSLSGVTVTVDGVGCAVPCTVQRAVGASVRIGAPASIPLSAGSRADFAGWSVNGAAPGSPGDWTGTLSGDPLNLTAVYRTMNLLATAADPAGSAAWQTVPSSPDGFYDAQSTVAIAVSPLPGFRFRAWTGDLSGSAPSGTLSMSVPRTVKALFDSVPYIAPSGVSNAAGITPNPGLAPGSVVSIFGANLAPLTASSSDSPLPQTLGGVTVRIGDRLLPLMFVSPGQINLQLPPDLPIGPNALDVGVPGLPDALAPFTVVRDAPGLFQQVVNNQPFAVVLHEDGSLVTSDSPARHGELLSLYGTGLGPTAPTRPEGFAVPALPPYALLDAATVLVGDATIAPENAFAAPGRVGIDIVQFRLSEGGPTGVNAALHVTLGDADSNQVLLPVE